jgi:predicted ATP-dependent protease
MPDNNMVELNKYELPPDKLRWTYDHNMFNFKCTGDLAPLREFIGQERASRAVEFGLSMKNSGYNIFVAGLSGTGKTSMVKRYIERLLKDKKKKVGRAPLNDWCYIHNFKEPDHPQIVDLPQGKGKHFRDDISELFNRLKAYLGRAFASEQYQNQRKKLVEESRNQQQSIFDEVSQKAQEQGFLLQVSQMGPVLIPIVDGHAMEEKDYLALDKKTRKSIDTKQKALLQEVRLVLEMASDIQRQTFDKLQKTDKEVGEFNVSKLFSPLIEQYSEAPKIIQFLNDLKEHTLNSLEYFKTTEEPLHPVFGVPMSQAMGEKNPFLPFRVNVFVDNADRKGPPVIIEPNPNFGNIFGKIERRFVFGGYLSDHTMLKAGALSVANGGYLLLNATEVLINPGVWPALKRIIRDKEVRIEDPFEQFGLLAPQGMKPEPMPIDIKIVLIGDAMIYQTLAMYDEDFWEIFKVKADFNYDVERNDKNILDYAAFIKGCCEDCEARQLDPTGVAKILEQSARIVADQERLSSRFAQIKEWIEEADYWASQDKSTYITAKHIQKALDERYFRHNLLDERMRDMITRGTIMIDVTGKAVGQVNGLSVYSTGDIMFGKPARITAKTFLGRNGVINIERESQLSGPIHNKGVMILGGYLGSKYAQDTPLSLSASLCFEQSYEGVEGDSASSTELYAILSSLSAIPIKQNLAVTGSVNQMGEIQPIGGVNQKIEGFFQVCQATGLTGDQGVLIPTQNVKNLMLREEVVEAVRNKKFHIYTAKTIDEGIEILTDIEAGARQDGNTYPEGTINFLVNKKLEEMAIKLKGFYAEEKKRK